MHFGKVFTWRKMAGQISEFPYDSATGNPAVDYGLWNSSLGLVLPLPVDTVGSEPYHAGENAKNSSGYMYLAPVTRGLWLYVSPVLFTMGIVGNIFSLIVLNSKRMRKSRCQFVLCVLACVDMTVLCIALLRNWFKSGLLIGEVRSTSQAMCKVHSFLSYGSRQVSSWTLTLLAVERLVSVYSPLKAKQWLSKERTVIFWCCIVAFISTLNTPLLVWRRLEIVSHENHEDEELGNTTRCGWVSDAFQRAVWWTDFALLCCIPLCVMCPCNVLIVVKIKCCQASHLQHCSTRHHRKGKQPGRVSSMTFMLLLVCVVFVITTIPIMAFFLTEPMWRNADGYLVALFYVLCNLLYYTNSAINFVLYCLGGSKFRQAACDVIQGLYLKRKKGGNTPTASEVGSSPMFQSRKGTMRNGEQSRGVARETTRLTIPGISDGLGQNGAQHAYSSI